MLAWELLRENEMKNCVSNIVRECNMLHMRQNKYCFVGNVDVRNLASKLEN